MLHVTTIFTICEIHRHITRNVLHGKFMKALFQTKPKKNVILMDKKILKKIPLYKLIISNSFNLIAYFDSYIPI